MSRLFSVENLLDCIVGMEPIQASEIAGLLRDILDFRGDPIDLNACKWTGNPPRSCNHRTVIDLIEGGEITVLQELQRLHACASIIGLLDDEESSQSTSSQSTSASSSSQSTSHLVDCVNYRVRSPQSFETETSTLGLIMEPLMGNVYWDTVIANGNLQITILEIIGKRHGRNNEIVPPDVSVDHADGEVIYLPHQWGWDAGAKVNVHVLFTDTAGLCDVDVWLLIVVTEETTTAA